ncbi:MAG: hypothetical protein JSS21_08845 [Proteobacteria bacterium]|nr:hypothetical protein [Pseudomonadota bacterium]
MPARAALFSFPVFLAFLAVPAARAQQDLAGIGVREQQIQAVDRSEQIMAEAEKRKGILAQYQVMRRAYATSGNPNFRVIFGQYLSWYQTFIGDYPDALQSFAIKEQPQSDDAPMPSQQQGWHPVQARVYLPILAKPYKAVFFNEAHNVPLTRTLTVQLLQALRDEGFNTFAVETLYRGDTDLPKRGYPTAKSGFYTREPIYAEMVRTALKLGYKVVAYEADDQYQGDAREAQQARHLARLFKDDPDTRLVVNAGYAHIQKEGKFLGGQSMAEHFIEDSGITPLAIEQTMMISHDGSALDHPYYTAIVQSLDPPQPVVFVDTQGKPWSLRPGYDVSVLFPATHLSDGRPTWLTLGGLRVPYHFDGSACQNRFPCLIEARYADEGDDAIPADRMVLDVIPLTTVGDIQVTTSGSNVTPTGNLYLRPGKYHLRVSDENDNVIAQQSITVQASSAAVAAVRTGPSNERCIDVEAAAVRPLSQLCGSQ